MYCAKWNRRIRYNTDLLAIHDEAFLSHSVGAARFRFDGKSHDFWCWKNFHWNFIAHRQPFLTGTPGSLKQKELLWSGWSTAPLLPFSFPLSHREVHKDSRVPARYIVADQTAGLTLEPLEGLKSNAAEESLGCAAHNCACASAHKWTALAATMCPHPN